MSARLGSLLVAVLAQVLLLDLSAGAAELPYLFEQLKKPTYKASFNALFRSEKNLAPWLRAYLKDRNGVDTPGQTVTDKGRSYELYEVCEPHNCPGNDIYVLFTPGGGRGWGLFTKDGGNYRFFGSPDEQQRAMLTAAATR